MKKWLLRGGLALLALWATLWIAAGFFDDYPRYELPKELKRPAGLYHYRGQIHIHSKLSKDASGSIDQIVAAGKSSGMDFLVLSDHNTRAGLKHQKYHGKILVLSGVEISGKRGHFTVLGHSAELIRRIGAHRKAELVIINHPDRRRGGWDWDDQEPANFDALEILNGGSIFKSAARFPYVSLLTSLFFYPVNPVSAATGLLRRPDQTLKRWDQLNRQTRKTGLYGVDAHGRISYERSFRLASTHILSKERWTGDFTTDRRSLLKALKKGRVYLAFDSLAPADGFVYRGHALSFGRRQELLIGDTIHKNYRSVLLTAKVQLLVEPSKVRLTLFHDGRSVKRRDGPSLRANVSTRGCYRVEVELWNPGLFWGGRWTPWIFSNPICLAKPFSSLLR